MPYDVSIITVRPGAQAKVLPRLDDWRKTNSRTGEFLACWYSEIGALNQILLLHHYSDETALIADRDRLIQSGNPFGAGEFFAGITMDTYIPFPFLEPMKAGQHGPIYEVRIYEPKPDGVSATMALWQNGVPARAKLSPLLAAMYTVTGPSRFLHIWPYASLDERQRIRAKAVETGVWPPPGGPDKFLTMQSNIFLPAAFSPMR